MADRAAGPTPPQSRPQPRPQLRPRPRPTIRGTVIAALVVAALLVPALFVAAQSQQPEQVTGFVLGVRARPPLGVESFNLLAGDGRTLTFELGELDVTNGFDAAHLLSHQASLLPVIVSYRRDGDRLVAVRLNDGPVPSTLPPVPGTSIASASPARTTGRAPTRSPQPS